MPFKPGDPKPPNSGRKKGQKNKKKLVTVEEVLHDLRIHPVKELLILVKEMPPTDAARIWLDLLKYCAPMLKAVEPEPADEPTSEDPADSAVKSTSTENLLELAKRN